MAEKLRGVRYRHTATGGEILVAFRYRRVLFGIAFNLRIWGLGLVVEAWRNLTLRVIMGPLELLLVDIPR